MPSNSPIGYVAVADIDAVGLYAQHVVEDAGDLGSEFVVAQMSLVAPNSSLDINHRLTVITAKPETAIVLETKHQILFALARHQTDGFAETGFQLMFLLAADAAVSS